MTEEEIKKSKCTITFETPDGDKAVIDVQPGTDGTLTFTMKMLPPDPKKYENITGHLLNEFFNMINHGQAPEIVPTGPGGDA